MTALSLLYVFAAVVFLALAGLVLRNNVRSRLNWCCALVLAALMVWSFEDIFHSNPLLSPARAELLANVGSLGWLSFASLNLLFILVFTRRRRVLHSWPVVLLMIGLPVTLIVAQWSGHLASANVHTSFGWVSTWSNSVWTVLFYVYYLSFTAISFYFALRFRSETSDRNERKQAGLISATGLAALLLGSLTDFVLPHVARVRGPELAGPLMLIWAGGLYYSVVRYGMMRITPKAAADEIIATMRDSLLLLTPEGRIVSVNQAVLDLLEYTEADLIGKSAAMLFTSPASYDAALQQVGKEGELKYLELTCRTSRGKEIPASVSARVMREGRNVSAGIVWVLRDTSWRQEHEAALRRAYSELEQMVRERTGELTATNLALRASEEKYRNVVENASEAIVVLQDGRVKFANPRASELAGFTLDEFKGSSFLEFVHPDDRQMAGENHLRRLKGERVESVYSLRLMAKDGRTLWVEVRVALIDWEGRPAALDFLTNITRRKQAEQALRESEQVYRDLADNALVGVYRTTAQGEVLYANDTALRICGFKSLEDMKSAGAVARYKNPEDRLAMVAQLQTAGRVTDFEFELLREDGESRNMVLNAILDGKVISGMMLDITERKQAEAALQRSEERFRKLVETTSDWIWEVDENGRYTYASPRVLDVLGYAPEDVVGKTPFDLMPPDEAIRVGAVFQKIAAAQKAFSFLENRNLHRDGREVVLESSGTPIFDDTGAYRGYRGLDRNITERKRAEAAVEARSKELARSNAELQNFARVASHDLQEPLRMVVSYTQLLARRYRGKLDERADKFIAYAVDGAFQMQNLINDLLSYSRLETRGREPAPTDCRDVLRLARENLRRAIKETGAEVSAGELPVVSADSAQLVQLFQNLIANAIKFHGQARPRVHVSAVRRNGDWLFAVQDNGIGVAPEQFERIFQIFQRLHARSEYPGTGIGLALCKRIVERHGGRIWVESQPGQGSTFNFTLPRKEQTDGRPAH